jgi:hypothetical protein
MPKRCRTIGTTIKELRAALTKFGIRSRYESIGGRKYRSLKFDAVLCGKVAQDTHWVVWDHHKKRKIDPWRTPLRFECTSFLKIIK